jgi:hypothetical protein
MKQSIVKIPLERVEGVNPTHSRRESNPGFRSGGSVWRVDNKLNEQVKRNKARFPLISYSGLPRTKGIFDVAICDLKTWTWRTEETALRVHRAWCHHGRERA